jgi:hypothetical protein
MGIRQTELVKRWGLSKSWVSQMVKNGLPLSSIEEAEAWKLAHYGPGRKASPVEDVAADNMPGDWLPPAPEPVNDANLGREDIFGTLTRIKKNELIAWDMLAAAFESKNDLAIQTRQKHWREAAGLRITLEGKADEILIQRKELVLMDEAMELFGCHLQALRMALKNLPTRIAARCNPSDPNLAKQILNESIDRIFKTMNEWEV